MVQFTTRPSFPPPPTKESVRTALKQQERASRPSPSRLYTLPSIVVLSFVTFILAIIYANCIALPHTEGQRGGGGGEGEGEDGDSAYKLHRRNEAADQGGKQRGDAGVLFAYTALLPLLTFIHAATESSLYLGRPAWFTTRNAHILTLSLSSLLVAAWSATASLWTVCELTPLGRPVVCPAAVRGHFMYGIHEVSVAKAVLACLVVALYGVHTACVGASASRLRRVWKVQSWGGALGRVAETETQTRLGCEVVIALQDEDADADQKEKENRKHHLMGMGMEKKGVSSSVRALM